MRTNEELTDEQLKEANEIIDLLEDAIDEISHFSAYNDDIFNYEQDQLYELVKSCRKQLQS